MKPSSPAEPTDPPGPQPPLSHQICAPEARIDIPRPSQAPENAMESWWLQQQIQAKKMAREQDLSSESQCSITILSSDGENAAPDLEDAPPASRPSPLDIMSREKKQKLLDFFERMKHLKGEQKYLGRYQSQLDRFHRHRTPSHHLVTNYKGLMARNELSNKEVKKMLVGLKSSLRVIEDRAEIGPEKNSGSLGVSADWGNQQPSCQV